MPPEPTNCGDDCFDGSTLQVRLQLQLRLYTSSHLPSTPTHPPHNDRSHAHTQSTPLRQKWPPDPHLPPIPRYRRRVPKGGISHRQCQHQTPPPPRPKLNNPSELAHQLPPKIPPNNPPRLPKHNPPTTPSTPKSRPPTLLPKPPNRPRTRLHRLLHSPPPPRPSSLNLQPLLRRIPPPINRIASPTQEIRTQRRGRTPLALGRRRRNRRRR